MKKTELMSIVGIGIVTMLVLAAVVTALTPLDVKQEAQQEAISANGEQNVQLSFKNGNYYPSIVYLKVGVPTKIVVDTEKVNGCMRTIVIPSMNIRKTITAEDNVIEFTPTKEGTIPFSCSMGMGRGTFIVTNDGTDGTANSAAPLPQQQNSAVGGSCGSGGCGCGAAR